MNKKIMTATVALCSIASACGGGSEAVPVDLDTVVSSQGITTMENDLGYQIEITGLRVALKDIQFTIRGEEHTSVLQRVSEWLVPTAYAHPGHAAGGEVTGELLGNFVVDWMDDASSIGRATLLTGRYQGANFTFRAATADDGLDAADPLLGHCIHVSGTATRDASTVTFDMILDIDPDTQLIGAPFEFEVKEGASTTLALEILSAYPVESTTLFDGVDFIALDTAAGASGAISVMPGSETHNRVRRLFQSHDFYSVETR